MIDRIGGVGGIDPLRGIGEKEKKVEKSKGKIKESSKTEVRLRISEYVENAKNAPEIREKLVEEIKKAVESGQYVVDVERIARKLLGGG